MGSEDEVEQTLWRPYRRQALFNDLISQRLKREAPMADLLATRSSESRETTPDWGFAAFLIITFAIAVALTCVWNLMQ